MARFDVILATSEFPPLVIGGLGIYVSSLLANLIGDGLSVAVVCPLLEGSGVEEREWLTDDCCVYRLPVGSDAYSAEAADEMNAAVEALFGGEIEAPVVHVHEAHMLGVGERGRSLMGAEVVFTVHLSQRQIHHYLTPTPAQRAAQEVFDELEARAMASADRIIAVSDYMKALLVGEYQIAPEKIASVYYPGAEIASPDNLVVISEAERQALREKLLRGAERLALFVGRDSPQKGLRYYLEAVTSDLLEDRIRALVIGGATQISKLYQLVDPLRASNVIPVPFLDWDDLSRFYQVADVGVICSLAEPFGIVALEMVACGVPLVYSDIDGLGEILGPLAAQTPCLEPVSVRTNGVRSLDATEVAAAIDALLSRVTPELHREYLELGRSYLAERFSEERFVAVHREAYGLAGHGDTPG